MLGGKWDAAGRHIVDRGRTPGLGNVSIAEAVAASEVVLLQCLAQSEAGEKTSLPQSARSCGLASSALPREVVAQRRICATGLEPLWPVPGLDGARRQTANEAHLRPWRLSAPPLETGN